MDSTRQRKILLAGIAAGVLLLSLGLAALNAFRLSSLNPSTIGELFLFTTLTVVAFLLFVIALLLLVRNGLRIYGDEQNRLLGARLRTRLVVGAVLISLLPITAMFLFSYQLMNRAVERWFSQPAAALRGESAQLAQDLSLYVTANARAEASSIAGAMGTRPNSPARNAKQLASDLESHETTLQGGFVVIYRDGEPIVHFQVPATDEATVQLQPTQEREPRPLLAASKGPLVAMLAQAAQGTDNAALDIRGTDYLVGSAWHAPHDQVVVALPMPVGLSSSMQRLQRDGDLYWLLFRQRKQIRLTYMLLMLMISTLALFCASWLALQFSKQVTRPVEALAEAMAALARGDYNRRVDAATTEELGELVAVFNTMAAELQNSRDMVERSTEQVVQANATLESRRRELETMLQTIPNSVLMLDPERRIRLANRAFGELIDPGGERSFLGSTLHSVLPPDVLEPVERLLQRACRMGAANGEMEMRTANGTLNLSVSAALLEQAGVSHAPNPGHGPSIGFVVVLEDATELLRAQKQSAWKEVARRVAHEIKNPLTPISLSAEQIRRHIGRLGETMREHALDSPSLGTIHRSSEVITSSVESMRSLVNQFAALAEFPSARPRPADLNTIVENTLAVFAGRLEGVQVSRSLAPSLPLVMADPEALKRALSNLIDNAAEAMANSLLKEIRIRTGMAADSEKPVELVVEDSGPGVTDEMRERLFLPYFSTKQRGSGLGLTIAAKIIADHRGTIRVEKNQPAGARFVIDLPVASVPEDVPVLPGAEQPSADEVLQ